MVMDMMKEMDDRGILQADIGLICPCFDWPGPHSENCARHAPDPQIPNKSS